MTEFNLTKYQETLLLKDDINLLQFRILIYLSHWMGKNNHVWPTNDMILNAMPTSSLDSIKKRIKELDKKKYIEREMVGKRRNIYLLDLKTGTRFEPRGTPQVPQKTKGDSSGPHRGTPAVPLAPIYNKEKENNDVVVSLALKYGFNIDEKIIRLLDGFPDKKLIDMFEYTKSKKPDNPCGFIFDAVRFGWNIPEYKDPYAAERERIEKLIADSKQAKQLGFKTAGYSH